MTGNEPVEVDLVDVVARLDQVVGLLEELVSSSHTTVGLIALLDGGTP